MKFDCIVIGGGATAARYALEALKEGKSCAVVASGLSLEQVDWASFVRAGGVFLKGDKVVSATLEGSRVQSLRTSNLGDDFLVADTYILATGKYFSGGLVVDMDSIYEPIFGLDLKYDSDREAWFDEDFFAPQPFMSYGVVVDEEGHPSVSGIKIENLIAAGEILASTSL